MGNYSWQQALSETYQELAEQFLTFVPQIITACIVFVAGLLIASVLGRVTEKLINTSERLISKLWQDKEIPVDSSVLASVARKVTFWIVLLFFIAAGIQVIEWPFLTKLIGDIGGYFPKLVVGLLVIFAGFVVGKMAYSGLVQTQLAFEHRFMLGRVLQVAIILTTVLIGIEQIGINIQLLSQLILVIVGVVLFGFVLTFALAARDVASNLLAMRQCQTLCPPGTYIKLGDVEGRVLELTATQIVVEQTDGVIYLPAEHLQKQHFSVGEAKQKS